MRSFNVHGILLIAVVGKCKDFKEMPAFMPGQSPESQQWPDHPLRPYEATFNRWGRPPSSPSRSTISLDFEVEMGTVLDMTPDLLLMRSGIHLGSSCSGQLPQFPNKSSNGDWSVGIDGVETKGRQQLQGRLEATTRPMRPGEILKSPMLNELDQFFHTMIPRPKGKQHPLVPGSKDLYYHKSHHMEKRHCTRCHLQYTIGIDLRKIPQLLERSDPHAAALSRIRTGVHDLCASRQGGCNEDYVGLLTLVSWVLAKGHHCSPCWTPKLCMIPWLVRTHFGDMARFVAEEHGEQILATFPEDVLEITNLSGESPAFPGPYREYLQFKEFAELGGPNMVQGSIEEMVKTKAGLCGLATAMVEPSTRQKIDDTLLTRECGFKDMSFERSMKIQNSFTARQWLEGITKGHDLLSDVDSSSSARASSHLVWKSMGAWRMSPKTRGIVYVECRIAYRCLQTTHSAMGSIDMILKVTKEMEMLEHKWFSPPINNRLRGPSESSPIEQPTLPRLASNHQGPVDNADGEEANAEPPLSDHDISAEDDDDDDVVKPAKAHVPEIQNAEDDSTMKPPKHPIEQSNQNLLKNQMPQSTWQKEWSEHVGIVPVLIVLTGVIGLASLTIIKLYYNGYQVNTRKHQEIRWKQ